MNLPHFRLVSALVLPLCLGCSRTQPVATTPPTQPVVTTPQTQPVIPSTATSEPPADDPVHDLQQKLAGVLVPTFEFPDVEGFERGEAHQFEDPRMGYSFPYDSRFPKITATVYVYNRGLTDIPDGLASPRIKDEVDEVEQSLPEMVRRGYYTSYARRGNGERDVGTKKALWRSFELGHADGTLASEVYVTAARNGFIKIRCTYPADCGEDCEKKVAKLVDRLGEIIHPEKVAE